MERITMSIDEGLAHEFDTLIESRGYTSRSEAMRDLLRREIEVERQRHETRSQCVASLSYIYNHHARDLAERLTADQHAHHDLTVSAMHVNLDHDHCLETVVLRGPTADVRAFANRTLAERGVRNGAINLVTVDADDTPQAGWASSPWPDALDAARLSRRAGVGAHYIWLSRRCSALTLAAFRSASAVCLQES